MEELEPIKQKLKDVDKRIDGIVKAASHLPAAERLAIHSALLAEAGSMARHYSSVRLGLTTFLIGVSLAIMNFKWDDFDLFALVAAGTTWLLAVGLFAHFTSNERAQLEYRRDSMYVLNHTVDPEKHTEPTKLSAGQRMLRMSEDSIDWARIALAILTLAFGGGCYWWATHTKSAEQLEVVVKQPVQAEVVGPIPLAASTVDVNLVNPVIVEMPADRNESSEKSQSGG